jgi:hypothetical protein
MSKTFWVQVLTVMLAVANNMTGIIEPAILTLAIALLNLILLYLKDGKINSLKMNIITQNKIIKNCTPNTEVDRY